MASFTKDPQAVKDYGWTWARRLADGEVIVASTWAVDDPGLTIDDDSQFTDTTTAVWVSGGELGALYTVTNHITTSEGREDDRSHTIFIRDL